MFAMVDLKISNLQSVREAFRRVGAQIEMVSGPEDIERASAVILPGIGAFGDGIESLSDQGLIPTLRRHALEAKKPIFGICLGMQLVADQGEEYGLHQGLGLIRARTVRLPEKPGMRTPNMGWCDVTIASTNNILFAQNMDGQPFYFAHSYYLDCADQQDVIATLDYGGPLTAAIKHENIFGIQFHPEKSQEAGLDLLESFTNYVWQNFGQ